MIKNLPIEENPREKALSQGIESLSNVELLALILRTGNKEESVLQLAQRLLNEIGGFQQLRQITYAKLISLKGINKAKAIAILSIIEIAKRLKEIPQSDVILQTPEDIFLYVKNELMFLSQENFVLICLDCRNHVIKKKTIFVGTVQTSLVTPREVFKEAIEMNSSKIILVHNHPSGDAHPSHEDLSLTKNFLEIGTMLDIEVLDHVIIGWNQYFSVAAMKFVLCEKD
ncbi:MAG: DNA repair protein RadC [Erysipelotrichaceae bacterium]|nr:DNA repair protein RadC [Erysipelotrichaceae bacterium]